MTGFYKQIICERCGLEDIGTSSTKYCIDCKYEVLKERKRIIEKKRRIKAKLEIL